MCRVSNLKCVRFVSSIPLKSVQRIKEWKGTLRLRAYDESLLQQIGRSSVVIFRICRLTFNNSRPNMYVLYMNHRQ